MFNDIDNLIQENKYSKHSFINYIENNDVDPNNLKKWAIQKYFQVYHQNCGFSAIHANCPFEDVRQFEVEQLIEEETDLMGGSASHYNMMKRFAFALGATEEDFLNTPMAQPVKKHIARIKEICLNQHFVYGLFAFYIFESQTPESALRMYRAFKNRFNFSDETLEWFLVHGSADVEHSNKSRDFILKYCHEIPDFHEKKIDFVLSGVNSWKELQDYYYQLLIQ